MRIIFVCGMIHDFHLKITTSCLAVKERFTVVPQGAVRFQHWKFKVNNEMVYDSKKSNLPGPRNTWGSKRVLIHNCNPTPWDCSFVWFSLNVLKLVVRLI